MAGENQAPPEAPPAPAPPAQQPQPASDVVPVPAAELVRLRARAQLADSLERDSSEAISAFALAEATGATVFANETAASHARTLLASRIVVRPDANGKLVAFDKVSGYPAASTLRELVNGPEFSMYRAASQKGGGGGGNTPSATAPKDDVQARREALARRMTTQVSEGGSPGIGGFGGRSSF